jgi:hypothetical protein
MDIFSLHSFGGTKINNECSSIVFAVTTLGSETSAAMARKEKFMNEERSTKVVI